MSFHTLPTELDVAIAGFLGRDDLSRLSQCSKYYRAMVEPILYNDLVFWTDEHVRIKQLLLILVNRKDLREMVHHFRLYRPKLPVTETPISLLRDNDRAEKVYKDLLENRDEIGNIIEDICSRFPTTYQYQVALFAKVFEPTPLHDGAVALIICIATELQTLELDFSVDEPLLRTRYLVTGVDWRLLNATPYQHPLHAIKTLRMRYGSSGSRRGQLVWGDFYKRMPGLETLSICNSVHLRSLPHVRLQPTDPATLSTLELKDVNFEPRLLLDFIKCTCVANLKTLAVVQPGQVRKAWSNISWDLYDYENLKKAMLEHIPKLQSLIWLGTAQQRVGRTFGSFAGFTQLKELVVESDLVFDLTFRYQEPQVPSYTMLSGLFPQSLKVLELSNMDWEQLIAICDWFWDNWGARRMSDELATLQAFIASLPMQEIFFTMNLTPRTVPKADEPLLGLLLDVAEALESLGTKFQYGIRQPTNCRHSSSRASSMLMSLLSVYTVGIEYLIISRTLPGELILPRRQQAFRLQTIIHARKRGRNKRSLPDGHF